jgi:2-phosphosulfolactate phosphatase
VRRIHCEWGLSGARYLAGMCDTLVIVDVLSFSTSVDVAVGRGALVYPAAPDEPELGRRAASLGAALAGRRDGRAMYSLSPQSLIRIAAGTRLVLPSPNGAAISAAAATPAVFAGCLRNAGAVAAAVAVQGGDIGIVPAGERWPDGTLRPAIEDLLGAGAIIAALGGRLTPEARAARAAFTALRGRVPSVLHEAQSGRALIAQGFAGDVALAAERDVSVRAPRLIDGAYRA